MSIGLDKFAQQQIEAQGLTVKEFARRAGLGLSHAYQILRGQRLRPSAATFEAVARGLNMTTAEMLVAMGRSRGGLTDPEDAEWLALVRQVPAEKKPAAKDMLRGLAVEPVPPAKAHSGGRANSVERRRREILTGSDLNGENEAKRRQFAIRTLLDAPQYVLESALSALGLNRDSHPSTATA